MSTTNVFWTPKSSIDYRMNGDGWLVLRLGGHPFGSDEINIEKPPGMTAAQMLTIADYLLAGVQEWRDSIAAAAAAPAVGQPIRKG